VRIKAVIFDLGDTLLNYGRADLDALFLKGAHLTYDYLAGCGRGALGPTKFKRYHRQHIRSIKLHALWSNLVDREFDCLALLLRKVTQMQIQLNRAQLEELAWLWYAPLAETASIEPNLHHHLRVLSEQLSVKLAIISNTFLPGVVLDRHLEQLDLLGFFPVRQYSSSTVFRKPDPRIFRGILDQLEVPAAAAVMVGDKVREDIKGAAKLGINPVFKRHAQNGSAKVPPGVPVIDSIGELPDLIGNFPSKHG